MDSAKVAEIAKGIALAIRDYLYESGRSLPPAEEDEFLQEVEWKIDSGLHEQNAIELVTVTENQVPKMRLLYPQLIKAEEIGMSSCVLWEITLDGASPRQIENYAHEFCRKQSLGSVHFLPGQLWVHSDRESMKLITVEDAIDWLSKLRDEITEREAKTEESK